MMMGALAFATVAFAAGHAFEVPTNQYGNPIILDTYSPGLSIKKAWDDEGNESNRPEEITVEYQLKIVLTGRNGESVTKTQEGSVVLSEDNNWSEKIDYNVNEIQLTKEDWSKLDANSIGELQNNQLTLDVEEVDVPDGYVADYEWDDRLGMLTITNRYDPTDKPSKVPGNEIGTTVSVDSTTGTTDSVTPSEKETTVNESAPKTGDESNLMFPLAMVIVSGTCIVAALAVGRKHRKNS